MFKRVFLSLSFVAALCVVSLGFGGTASAYHCDDDFRGYGYSTYYPSYGYGYGYAPRVSYYRAVPLGYRSFDWDHHHHGRHGHHDHHDRHHHDHGGVHFSIGF